MTDLEELLREVKKTTGWDETQAGELIMLVHDTIITTHNFSNPVSGMVGLTLNEWQHEQAKRISIAVLQFLRDAFAEDEDW